MGAFADELGNNEVSGCKGDGYAEQDQYGQILDELAVHVLFVRIGRVIVERKPP